VWCVYMCGVCVCGGGVRVCVTHATLLVTNLPSMPLLICFLAESSLHV